MLNVNVTANFALNLPLNAQNSITYLGAQNTFRMLQSLSTITIWIITL